MERMIKAKLQQGVMLLLIAFAIYAMINAPVKTAHVVQEIASAALAFAGSVGDFFDALLGTR